MCRLAFPSCSHLYLWADVPKLRGEAEQQPWQMRWDPTWEMAQCGFLAQIFGQTAVEWSVAADWLAELAEAESQMAVE